MRQAGFLRAVTWSFGTGAFQGHMLDILPRCGRPFSGSAESLCCLPEKYECNPIIQPRLWYFNIRLTGNGQKSDGKNEKEGQERTEKPAEVPEFLFWRENGRRGAGRKEKSFRRKKKNGAHTICVYTIRRILAKFVKYYQYLKKLARFSAFKVERDL